MLSYQIGRCAALSRPALRSVSCRPHIQIRTCRRTSSLSTSSSSRTPGKIADKIPGELVAKPSQPPVSEIGLTVSPALPIWKRLGPLTRAFDAYARSQKKRPYVTQVASALVIFLCADLSAQGIGDADYDPVRTARTQLIGAVSAIPQYKWFFFLSTHFNYSSRTLSLAVKVLFNQFTFAAMFSTYFFASQALLSGETFETTIDRVQKTVPRVWVNSWKVWPATVAIALTLVPLEYRALFSGFVAIGWQTYLSWANRRAELIKAVETTVQDSVVKELARPVELEAV